MRILFRNILLILFACFNSGEAKPATGWRELHTTTPRVFLLDPELLIKAKQAVKQKKPGLMPAAKKLRSDAEKILDSPVYSVVNKPITPPSGDKHDYMSMATYWWPNDKTPDGLPYVKRDGKTNPEINKLKNGTDMNTMITKVETAALAYYFYDDERYAKKAAQLLRTWFLLPETRMNPNLNYSQAIPGITDGRGIGIIDTHKFPFLIDAIGMLKGSPNWTDRDQRGMEEWFNQYLTWMLESKNGIEEAKEKNNHGTWYDIQVASYALFVNKPTLAKDVLQSALTKRLAVQVRPDGGQRFELSRSLSWNYSINNVNALFHLASLAEKVGINWWHYSTPDGRSLKKALDFLVPYATGEKLWTQKQIKSFNPGYLYQVLLIAAHKYPDAGYDQAAAKLVNKGIRVHKNNLIWPVL